MANTCPYCGYKNLEGALICEGCRALLFKRDEGEATRLLGDPHEKIMALPDSKRGTKTLPGSRIIFDLGDPRPRIVTLNDGDEITIGRQGSGNGHTADVLLDELRAWEQGVSRLHAAIRRLGDNVHLIDLQSTNGTYLNGQRIPPGQPQLLRDGDEIRLGQYVIHVYFVYIERE